MERSKVIFGNVQPDSVYRKAVKSKKKYAKKFGDDSGRDYSARVIGNEYIGDILGEGHHRRQHQDGLRALPYLHGYRFCCECFGICSLLDGS